MNVKDNDGVTPLHHACGNGHVQAVRTLVEGKADVDAEDEQGTTPLHAAAFNNHVIVIQILLQHASQNFGADLRFFLSSFFVFFFLKSFLIFFSSFFLCVPLFLIAPLSRLMLLSKQDKEGSTPLHKATFNGDVDVVKMFLESGVDLNALDKEGSTPLHKAAYKVRERKRKKTKKKKKKKKKKLILSFIFCSQGNAAIMQLLLAKSAALDIRDSQGGTALYNACYNGHTMCVKMLLEVPFFFFFSFYPLLTSFFFFFRLRVQMKLSTLKTTTEEPLPMLLPVLATGNA